MSYTEVMLDCLKSGVCPNLQCRGDNCAVDHRSFYGSMVTFDADNQPNNIVSVHDIVVVTSEGCWITYILECGTVQKSKINRHCVAYKNLHLCMQSERTQTPNNEFCRYIVCTECILNNNYVAFCMRVRPTKLTLFVDCFPRWRHFAPCFCCNSNTFCIRLMYTFNNVYPINTVNKKCYCVYCKHKQQPLSLFKQSLRAINKYKFCTTQQLFQQFAFPHQ
ncbi:Clas93 [Clostera anastomosis granulovirus B]|uniref:Clas93 n=1 Tax=Clostera anastomosis granulovirus B TaxID=1986290 RepID=A0A0K0WSA9_9BBAC|nr:Clas93 [Clostera anastomosis granulovirus B]AKS25436.1 Clas93 [Clostera anastomosis granulovirus B]